MKRKKTKWLVALLTTIAASTAALQAQTSLNVHEKSSTKTAFTLSNVQKLTFAGGNLTVSKKDASTSVYALTNVAYLNFSSITTAVVAPIVESKLVLYPNPTHDVLNIEFANDNLQAVQIEIVGIDSRVVLSSILQNTKNCISIDALPKGIYLVRCYNGNNVSSTKFIKQ